MSQSPIATDVKSIVAQRAYLENWDQLADMMSRGMSFSGRERNRCFLNMHHGKFADVSSASGFDLIDDTRGTALVDWDQDGDLDVWLSHRTAPSARILINQLPKQNASVALQLKGTTANRDALGARVQIDLRLTPPTPTDADKLSLSRTLRAGEGFLSQSSKWLHFGIPHGAAIERVAVRWPNTTEWVTYQGVAAQGRYQLTQGESTAVIVTARSPQVTLSESPAVVAPPTAVARTVLIDRPLFPPLDFPTLAHQNADDPLSDLPDYLTGPKLVVLWASWCTPCLTELSELAKNQDKLRSAGLNVIALSSDGLPSETDGETVANKNGAIDESSEGFVAATNFVQTLQAPFQFGWLTPATMKQLADLHRDVIYRQRPLPIPCSFLIDARGKLAVMYKGPVSTTQLLSDLRLLDARTNEIEAAASPFAGRVLPSLRQAGPLQLAQAFLEGGYWEDARAEIQRFLKQVESIEDLDSLADGLQQTLQPGAVHERNRVNAGLAKTDSSKSNASSKPAGNSELKSAFLAEKTRMLVQAYRLLARIEQDAGSRDRELTAIRQAVSQQPDNLLSLAELSVATAQAGKSNESRKTIEHMRELAGDDARRLGFVGQTWMKTGNLPSAIECFERAVQQQPDLEEAHLNLAMARQLANEPAAAIEHYEWIIAHNNRSVEARNNLAWLLATHAQAEFRNGARAEQLAKSLCEQTTYQVPAFLDTYAAACAENGNFDEATRIAEQAIFLSRATGEPQREPDLRAKLELYRAKQAYRSP